MENSGEEADDQGSGWLEVKKKHRSSAKFSVRNWDSGFSGKNYSSYQATQPSLTEKTANLSRKQRSQLPKKEAEFPPADHGHAANSSLVSVKYEDNLCSPNNAVIREDIKDCGRHNLQSSVNDSNFRVNGTQKVFQNDKPLMVPKIKWGDLEDDVLVLHHERHSQVDIKCSNIKDNKLVFRKPGQKSQLVSHVSPTNIQENKSVADAGVSPDQTVSLTSKEGQIYKNGEGLCEISAVDMEGPVMSRKTVAPDDASVCEEMGGAHVKAVSDDWLSSTYSSGEDAAGVVELQLSAVSADINEMEVSKVSVTNSDLVGILQDSKSEPARKSGIEVSGEMKTFSKPQLPAVNELKICEQSVRNENSDLALIPLENELLQPEKGDSKDSRESGMVVERQLPVISGENKSPNFEVATPVISGKNKSPNFEVATISGTPSAVLITQDCQSPALKKGEFEISGESTTTASVKDNGALLDAGIHDELLEVQSMGNLEEGDASESKERFRERLWCFLFENLNRAVDELYLLCELECDVEQMKEAILVLEEAASDFRELTARVQEFDSVKRSHSVDGAPVTLKLDHCRPHALSWEVRRMTTSPHRAEILSSSLDAFKKIQRERANKVLGNSGSTQGLASSNRCNVSSNNPKKSTRRSDPNSNIRELEMKSRRQSGASDHTLGNLNGERGNVEFGRSHKVNSVKYGLDPPHHLPSSSVSLSRIPSRENSTSFGTAKSKREPETEKLLHKKGKTLTENINEKCKSTDHLKKQIPVFEKDKERRNSTSWKSLDAWKEKRNWEDILSSPFRVSSRVSHSPGMSRKSAERSRILHDKLMSPEKKKKNAMDLKREAEEKHARAMRIRNELENERAQKLQRTSEKLNRVNEWQAVRTMKLREGMYARQQRSESRHEAFLAQVVRRAGDESSKVNEVRFITSLNEENKKHMLRQKQQGWELRRAEKLQVIKTKQKEDLAREEAVLERRKLIEAEKLQRLAETQRKKEEAQVRREEERKASSAAREARAFEQLRKREERAKAQQEEAEMLAQKLAEKLSESEQRRKFFLEQIRERASMDLRDQSSTFLRRSSNKEGQGRFTPSSNGEDYQENSVSMAGGCALATGTITLQHSQKRRIKRIRQRLMSLKYEFFEPPVGSENAGIGYKTAVGTARVKIGRWLQELKRLRQARKEGAASIGLITAEIIKFLEGKDPELQASRQAGLLDFIASALPASHTSKPEACQVTIHLLKLLKVVLSAHANRSYFLSQNLLPPIIPMLSAAIENYIKIAASLNVPGINNLPSSKASAENFEKISEVLDNFLWIVTIVIGHSSSDERELQMQNGLLELVIAYQVVHRLRDLFALYDRPQVEGSPFPSSILLSIYLLVVLTYRPRSNVSINWISSPIKKMLGYESDEAKQPQISDFGHSSINVTSEDCRPPLSLPNSSTFFSFPDISEDRPSDVSGNTKGAELVSGKKNGEKEPTAAGNLNNASTIDVPLESRKISIEKDEKPLHGIVMEGQNHNRPSVKQPIAYLLSALGETGLVSLPSLLTSVLLQANNRLSSEQGSYILPSNFDEVATGVLKVLNNLALLDITFVQKMLSWPDLKMEFFHLLSFLLSHCTGKWKAASDQIGVLLLESLLLLSYFALFHSENQAVLRWGKSPTILHKVCDLPFVFFSDPELMPILAGTLVAACYGSEQNKGVVLQELSMDMLLSLLSSCRNSLPSGQSSAAVETLQSEDPSESNQQSSELKRSQGDIPLKPSRNNCKTNRLSLGKSGKAGKVRSQRDCKAAKTGEEMASKYSPLAPETSLTLHSIFPSSFIDKAEQFFSA